MSSNIDRNAQRHHGHAQSFSDRIQPFFEAMQERFEVDAVGNRSARVPAGADAVVDARANLVSIRADTAIRSPLDEILIVTNGRLMPRDSTTWRQWLELVGQAAMGTSPALFCARPGNDSLHVLLTAGAGTDHVTIAIDRHTLCCSETLAAFANCHALTDAERRVATHLLNGAPPKRIALSLVRSEATIRTQIRSILCKTGSQSIRDLLLRLASLEVTAKSIHT
ncbi:MAG: hypothetical protein R3E87_22220 [Burkholderiaceae bacterium]